MPSIHYDGNDDHLPVHEDTLEPGDIDRHGNRDTNYEKHQKPGEDKEPEPVSSDDCPF